MKSLKRKIYCLCGVDINSLSMLCCDGCNRYYHVKCLMDENEHSNKIEDLIRGGLTRHIRFNCGLNGCIKKQLIVRQGRDKAQATYS